MHLESLFEHGFGFLNLLSDARKVNKLKWSSVFGNELHDIYAMEIELVIDYFKTFLRKVKGLVNEVPICVCHLI
jgi:hypothetical protein